MATQSKPVTFADRAALMRYIKVYNEFREYCRIHHPARYAAMA
jgi:hypothetical protein